MPEETPPLQSGPKGQPGLARSWDNVGKNTFVPEHYEFSNPDALMAYIAANPMAQLSSAGEGGLYSSVVPFVRAPTHGGRALRLAGHMAVRNPHARHIAPGGCDAIAHFVSPGAYISPRWFRKNITAPTFSYVSVQVRGRLVPVHDPDESLLVLARTVDHMEALTGTQADDEAWSMGALTPEQIERYVPMVHAFYLEVHDIEGIARLNQEKEQPDMEGIIEGLAAQPGTGAQHIAALMRRNLRLIRG
ncbi:FMN-binding negative transcriptional regulator [Kordiimonas aestuarii]|uniref:FMN-binding negative transcriptional regulator n=1 Tax=Kordiimonas aestuarii TaxID=1005925 RepID=UPI0021D2E708|nr:FMN-binding negative transcriptional regulator [Kordiimonas aestuarii]